jgi:hypothetical protein
VTTNTVNTAMNPSSTLILDMGASLPNTITGWIDILSSGSQGSMIGYAVFRTASGAAVSEGTTPLQATSGTKLILPFDNTGPFVTAFAISNLSASPATITMTVLDISGNQLGTCSVNFNNAYAHRSDLLPNVCGVSANQQGIVQFSSTSGGGLTGVGLRASTTTGTFTSIPLTQPQ